MSVLWNPWHGCRKISLGCENCYVYRGDARYGRESSSVKKTGDFSLPVLRDRRGAFKIPSGELVYTCFTSDFLLKDADEWRKDAWQMMRLRRGLNFLFITKRIDRLLDCLPPDWGLGYENVHICCTCENQDRADYRLPIFMAAPIRHKAWYASRCWKESTFRPISATGASKSSRRGIGAARPGMPPRMDPGA